MIDRLAKSLALGSLLEQVQRSFGGYELLEHWQRGEFHHDLVLRVDPRGKLPGPVLVVATNCNGGVKEILCFAEPPAHDALWHSRCPQSLEFAGELPPVLGHAKTIHWFDACVLLDADARSEYRPEYRERQPGGGWQLKACGARTSADGP